MGFELYKRNTFLQRVSTSIDEAYPCISCHALGDFGSQLQHKTKIDPWGVQFTAQVWVEAPRNTQSLCDSGQDMPGDAVILAVKVAVADEERFC